MLDYVLTRALTAFICGVFLTLTGSLSQIITQNPLAGPSTLGINALIIFLVLIAHSLHAVFNLPISPEWLSFGVTILTGVIIYLTRGSDKSGLFVHNRYIGQMGKILLMGLALNLLVGAIFSLLQFLFMTYNLQFPTELWFGNFRFSNPAILILLGVVLIIVLLQLWRQSKDFQLMSLGNDLALGFGVNVNGRVKESLFLIYGLNAVVVSFFGVFAFIGLVFPHIIRSIPGFHARRDWELKYGPFIGGAVFLLLDQLCTHITLSGSEIPVGMVSGVVGSFVLIVIIWKRSRFGSAF